jgi:perosamine synthetase
MTSPVVLPSKRFGVLRETRLTDEEMRFLLPHIPGPEPVLNPVAPRRIPVSGTLLDGNEKRYLLECIESNWISSAGPFVRRFEEAFASAVGCRFGVSCSSGTAALHLALAALGLGPGDEVIVPAFTMIATANAVAYTGASPVLADADPATWNVDVASVEARISDRTKAIVVVHTYGHPADMGPLRELASRRGLALVEDAAEAHGAAWRGRPVGSLGDAAAFSFYGNKVLSTGEGGMVTTNDAEVARVVRRLRDHAFSEDRHFWHTYLGFNYRMTNLQAAVGLAQCERLAALVDGRRRNARLYAERLAAIPGLTLPREAAGVTNVFWMYGVLVGEELGLTRDALREALAREGIETRTFFVPLHFQPIYFRRFRGERFPVAEQLGTRGLYLPSGPSLTEPEIDAVSRAVADAAGRRTAG